MEGKKYWIVEGKNFDTHWTTQTDRVSFKSDDLWEFMEAYHQAKLKLLGIGGVVGQSEQLPDTCVSERSKIGCLMISAELRPYNKMFDSKK